MNISNKIGFTCGAFDLLHAGHIVMLEETKQFCDYLIVGLQTDPSIERPSKNKPKRSGINLSLKEQVRKHLFLRIMYL